MVGGFAGGERGVQQFVDEGEVTIADKGTEKSREQAPVRLLLSLLSHLSCRATCSSAACGNSAGNCRIASLL